MFDFPTTPATGTVVTVPDGSYRVWDSQKWRASPSANVVIPPTGFLPLIGGYVSGILNLVDPGGAIQSNRNITFAAPSTNPANQPFWLTTTWTGTNTDPAPAPLGPVYATKITNTLSGFNTGGLGFRGFGAITNVGPLTTGQSISGVTSAVVQTAPFPPGTLKWAPNTAYATNVGVTNPNNQSSYYAVTGGTSASSGTGPSGQGQSITDGSVVWAYQGPGIPRYWAPSTSYSTMGELVINANNGGLFRVETQGTSGTGSGPVRPRGLLQPVRLASTVNIATLSGLLTVDGVVTVAGDRVLLKDQTAQAANGIYNVATGAWTRAVDFDTWDEMPSKFASVNEGATNASALPANGGKGFFCTVARGGTLGTTPITWTQVAAPNINAITGDGTVVWSLRGNGNSATSFIGLIGNQSTSFNAGGQSMTTSMGNVWGTVIGSRLNANATFYSASVPLEVDDVMLGSSRNIVALKVVRQGKQAQFTDIGVVLTANIGGITPDGTPVRGYKNAFMFNQSVDRDYGYGIVYEAMGAYRIQHMAGVIDTRMVVADGAQGPFGGGFLFRGPNGMYDQNGAWQLRYGSITPTASGLAIDVTNQELQSIAITSGGANWAVGDGWKGSDGSAGTVATVSSGAILTVSIAIRSQVPSPVPTTVTLSPFNPEPSFAAGGDDPVPGTVGPTGDVIWATPATGTPTYAAAATPTLSLMPSGGAVQVGTGCIAANATVATVLGSVGPVGSHTAVQEWIAIKNGSGVTRYIPAF